MKNLQLPTWTLCWALALLINSCSSTDNPEIPEPTPEPEPQQMPINLHCNIANTITKATDNAFEAGDRIGLYVVNYNGNIADNLQSTGNHVDNMAFTYNNQAWTPQSTIYWKDETTPADFYAYYPYSTAVTNVAAYAVEVKADQHKEADYKSSDFLWGKTDKVQPTESAVDITLSHLFSCAIVELVAGNGFTDADLAASDVLVQLNNAHCQATVNLSDGVVTPSSDTGSISFLHTGGNEFKALIIPQTIPTSSNFITVTIDGTTYNMEKDFTFIGSHRYRFTLTVRKTSNGINVDINDWVDDDVNHGGIAE